MRTGGKYRPKVYVGSKKVDELMQSIKNRYMKKYSLNVHNTTILEAALSEYEKSFEKELGE